MRCEDCKACYSGKPMDGCKAMARIIIDPYNPRKTWEVKRTKCGHFMLTQKIMYKQFGRKVRVTKKYLHELFPNIY